MRDYLAQYPLESFLVRENLSMVLHQDASLFVALTVRRALYLTQFIPCVKRFDRVQLRTRLLTSLTVFSTGAGEARASLGASDRRQLCHWHHWSSSDRPIYCQNVPRLLVDRLD